MKKIAIINGPNMDRLGTREENIYGGQTLNDLESILKEDAKSLGVTLEFHQSNHEGELVDLIWKVADHKIDGLIINPAAYTHTSVALGDALGGSNLPTIEVHLSNIFSRETFRHTSYTARHCLGTISGLGFEGYRYALKYLCSMTHLHS